MESHPQMELDETIEPIPEDHPLREIARIYKYAVQAGRLRLKPLGLPQPFPAKSAPSLPRLSPPKSPATLYPASYDPRSRRP
jgi:hypothetical protein